MKQVQLPKNVERVADDEIFSFSCHNKVSCFTDCCRHLELALTPYDTLRLKQNLKMHSSNFLDRYVIVEKLPTDIFPRYYLTMIDDGNVSCVFVTPEGCSVYPDRPGACRAYPMGRAAMRGKKNQLEQFFVLLHEQHCKGFKEDHQQTPLQYCTDQGLDYYNTMNDHLVVLLQHQKIREGMVLTDEQTDLYTLALYNLDSFREKLFAGELPNSNLSDEQKEELKNDEKLLLFGISWLKEQFFPNS